MAGESARARVRRSAGTAGMRAAQRRNAPGVAALPPGDWTGEDRREVEAGGTVRTTCLFRGTYGGYPRTFRRYVLDISAAGLVLRPPWYAPRRAAPSVPGPALSAFTRPYDPATDRRLRHSGRFAEGGRFDFIADKVIAVRNPQGTLEFAINALDAHLIDTYVRLSNAARGR